ncbi:MAG: diaminopimelate epimerase [Alphaproteobacteria bacterium]
MTALPFIKMHGLGNDFVVLDARRQPVSLDERQARAIADRHTGVGCDQVITVDAPRRKEADVFMRIQNADGDDVEACGNGTRCVAALLLRESGRAATVIETVAGLLVAERESGGRIKVDMGEPRLDWRDIPLRDAADTNHLALTVESLSDPCAVSMGNPHVVFFVPDTESVPLDRLGPRIEHDPIFPRRANVSVAQILDPRRIRLRVWERGVGITRACGSGACATVVAGHRRALVGRTVDVQLDGGLLTIEWRMDNHVYMTGPIAVSFTGEIDETLLSQGAAS